MSEALAAAIVALLVAGVRELTVWLDVRARRRGQKRSRSSDPPASRG